MAKTLNDKPVGFEVTLLTDDPASAPDLIAWTRMTGNSVETVDSKTFKITKLAN